MVKYYIPFYCSSRLLVLIRKYCPSIKFRVQSDFKIVIRNDSNITVRQSINRFKVSNSVIVISILLKIKTAIIVTLYVDFRVILDVRHF